MPLLQPTEPVYVAANDEELDRALAVLGDARLPCVTALVPLPDVPGGETCLLRLAVLVQYSDVVLSRMLLRRAGMGGGVIG